MKPHRTLTRFVAVLAVLAGLLAVPAAASAHVRDHRYPSAPDGARVTAVQQVADRQLDLTIASPAMGGSEKVRLLTPDGWRPGGQQHWPTLWLLHGCCGDYTSWTAAGGVTEIAALRRVLVVMPEAGDVGFYSDWLDRSARWETFHLREVLPIVERGFGASPDRAVAGLSMGGFGAVSYTVRHPGLFRATASFSGLVDTHYPGAAANIQNFLTQYGQNPDGLWGDPQAQAWIWALHNPTDLAFLLRRQPLFLSAGDGSAGPFDVPGSYDAGEALYGAENHALAGALQRVGAQHVVTDFYGPGQHKWTYWHRELERSIPMLFAALHC